MAKMLQNLLAILILATLSTGCGGDTEADRLVRGLGDERTYRTSSGALKELGVYAVPPLTKGLRNPDDKVREESARMLAFIGPEAKDAVPALIKALRDDVMVVRADAAWALGEIGASPEKAVPALMRALDDEEDTVRDYVIQALAAFGPDASDALPKIKDLAENDPNSFIRDSATEAIARIEGVNGGVDEVGGE